MARNVKASFGPISEQTQPKTASDARLRRVEIALWAFATGLWATFFVILLH